MKNVKTLSQVGIGERARVSLVRAEGQLARRLSDLGLISGTVVECVGVSPFGDPGAYLIRGAVIAIRRRDANNIFVYRELI